MGLPVRAPGSPKTFRSSPATDENVWARWRFVKKPPEKMLARKVFLSYLYYIIQRVADLSWFWVSVNRRRNARVLRFMRAALGSIGSARDEIPSQRPPKVRKVSLAFPF